jgi:hypothetical protein
LLDRGNKVNGEGFLGHGTENHALMMWSGGYLLAQYWSDAQWSQGKTSAELMTVIKEWLRIMVKKVYQMGYTEYLSTTYEAAMTFGMEILYEYADDPEVKAIAESYLILKWSILSLNTFEGEIIAPHARMNAQPNHDMRNQNMDSEPPAASYYNWVLWGWGAATDNVKLNDFRARNENGYNETSFAIFPALSQVSPDDVFFRLAASQEPFTQYSSAPMFGTFDTGAPRWMLRKIYRDKTFAAGTGNFRNVPGGDYAADTANGLMILWSSADRFNYINCTSPYWFADDDGDPQFQPDAWDHGLNSPFQQTAQNKGTIITLFDIPDKDPWSGNAERDEKLKKRDGHFDNLIKRGMFRFPKSMDEKTEKDGWFFLREGKTYIGIKPLKNYYIENESKHRSVEEFVVVKSDHAKTGFVFEVGSEEQFGSFDQFQSQLPKNKLEIDWEKMIVSYTDSKKETLQIQFIPGLPIVPVFPAPEHWERYKITGLAESVPIVTINGTMERFIDGWSLIQSPIVNLNNSVLKIDDGKSFIQVDWRGDLPKIKRK